MYESIKKIYKKDRIKKWRMHNAVPNAFSNNKNHVIQRAVGLADGKSTRYEHQDRMYNKLYWKHIQSKRKKKIEENSIHHIIPCSYLNNFWNVIVEYYPEMWSPMVKDIIYKATRIAKKDIRNTVFNPEFFDAFTRVPLKNYDANIDALGNSLQQRVYHGQSGFGGSGVTLPNSYTLLEAINGIYTWMPGNLVTGPLESTRPKGVENDPGSNGVDREALRARKANVFDKSYLVLFNKLEEFNKDNSIRLVKKDKMIILYGRKDELEADIDALNQQIAHQPKMHVKPVRYEQRNRAKAIKKAKRREQAQEVKELREKRISKLLALDDITRQIEEPTPDMDEAKLIIAMILELLLSSPISTGSLWKTLSTASGKVMYAARNKKKRSRIKREAR